MLEALSGSVDQFADLFTQMGGLMAERVTDLRDLERRLTAEIVGEPAGHGGDGCVVAREGVVALEPLRRELRDGPGRDLGRGDEHGPVGHARHDRGPSQRLRRTGGSGGGLWGGVLRAHAQK